MSVHTHTPTLAVVDPRGLPVREAVFCRSQPGGFAQLRVTQHAFDPAARAVASTDARLHRPNNAVIHSLGAAALLSENVDAGWHLELAGEGGQILQCWDARGTQSLLEYDSSMRPVALAEKFVDQPWQTVERMSYGASDAGAISGNGAGRLIQHDDPAGSSSAVQYSMTGALLISEQCFLKSLDRPDWPVDSSAHDELLDTQVYTSSLKVDALGQPIEQLDAGGHLLEWAYDCAGQLQSIGLTLAGSASMQTLITQIRYNAWGAVEHEAAGNGVVSQYFFNEDDGRPRRALAQSPGGQLQDLNYCYDPVGNIVSIEDAHLPTSFFRNQLADPVNHYRYDSLYQLVEATGREVPRISHGPQLPGVPALQLDPVSLVNYTQRFEYDAGGNLLARHHSGAQTWRMVTSADSNRSLAQHADGSLPDEAQITASFDANGNLRELQPGQTMAWDARNQLSEISAVMRDDGPDDGEQYCYDGHGLRVRKVRFTQTRSRTLISEVRYLPGLELHRNDATGEVRDVLTVQAASSSIRVLHWECGKPDGIANDQLRYTLTDHLGSCTLELDHQAKLISHEGYYPFGGTAWWTARNAIEAKYKTVRYSGKEQDATGLYYYGFRYYAPWLQRWASADPAGDVDGLNRYCLVMNNPVALLDQDGLQSQAAMRWKDAARRAQSPVNVYTVAPGVVAVRIRGGQKVFHSLGLNFPEGVTAQREIAWLSIDKSYQSKVSGGDRLLELTKMTASQIARTTGRASEFTAIINGGFFNNCQQLNPRSPSHASVGENFIDRTAKARTPVPDVHLQDFKKLVLDDGSFIHSAPSLSRKGKATFTRKEVERKSRFQFDPVLNRPGYLGHAENPNSRAGISRPAASTVGGRHRLFMTVTEDRSNSGPGYTLPEWADLAARIDRLDYLTARGVRRAYEPGSSVNLDGGTSVTLAVFNRAGETTFMYSYPRTKPVGNFISFHRQ